MNSGCYTAARIAAAAGMSKRGVLSALRGISSEGTAIVRGNGAGTWSFCSLPIWLQERLQSRAQRRGYKNAEQLLSEPPKAYQPPVPLSQAGKDHVDKACKLQRALTPAFARMEDATLSEKEFERLGVEDYRREFGFAISPRHWRRLWKRTLERDNGAEDFDRIELYLDEHATRENRSQAQALPHVAIPELDGLGAAFKNAAEPSAKEVAFLWTRAFEYFEGELANGKVSRKVKRRLLRFLFERAPFLAKTPAGLRVQFERKYPQWTNGGRLPHVIEDKRREKSGWHRAPVLSQADRDSVIWQAVKFHGGRLAGAWRDESTASKLSDQVLSHYVSNPADKSYVPRAIRKQVATEIASLADIHHGPRQAQLNGAYISRDWSTVPAGDWYQADDCTLPIYYYEPNAEGWFTLWRGQCLLMIDLRSTCILGYVLLSDRNYNSLAIRTVITRVCEEHGLPRKGFYFERGIWKSSKILTGGSSACPFSYAEIEGGLRDLGLRFIHAKLPRAKPIEGVLGAVQNLMEGEPGYAGRDERRDAFQRFQEAKRLVESRQLNPRERFRTADGWLDRLDEIFAQYNAAPQAGKMCEGLAPEEAFSRFQDTSDPQIKFGPECRYLLAHHRRPTRVTPNGITLRFGRNVFNYRSEATGHMIGQTVFAWFNPETPEVLCVTDTKGRNVFAVERSQEVPAVDAPPDLLAQELRRAAAHNAYTKAYYRILKAKFAPQFRRNLVAPKTAELGGRMESVNEAVRTARDNQHRLTETVRRKGARQGIPGELLRDATVDTLKGLEMVEAARRENQETLDQEGQR